MKLNAQSAVIRFIQTGQLKTIQENTPLIEADEWMRKFRVHHLPVLENGQYTGILSASDLKLALSFGDETELCAGDIMTPHPEWIKETAPVKEAIALMVEKRVGSLLVLDTQNHLIGIFTAHDALAAVIKWGE